MPKIAVILGTRPEAVKLCPLVLALREREGLAVEVCATAQHRTMLDQVLEVFGVAPDVDLDLMQPGQSLAGFAARAISALDGYLAGSAPDLVLVQGDTTTVFCAALAAFYHDVPVGHVEAGLRTGDKRAPFPEEINRVLASRLADLHFAPTAGARDNLLAEGVPAERVHVTGNTVVDALLLARERARRDPPRVDGLPPELLEKGRSRPLVLITGHRRESFGDGFEAICGALADLAERHPDTAFVYPVHLNPRVQEPVRRILGDRPNVHLLEPLSYLPFVLLMDRALLILTDSGGIQEEAPTLGKPVLVMREKTERPEGVAAGTSLLVGTDRRRIVDETERLLADPAARAAVAGIPNPYGDGRASRRIADLCAGFLAAR